MKTTPAILDVLRLRLLEGVLLRLARRGEDCDLVLRGGVLLRHWFRPLPRLVEDLDLVATFPFDVAEASRRIVPVFADNSPGDGMTYDVERVQAEGIWLTTGSPGVRVFVSGLVEGVEIDFHVDITFGPATRPAPILAEIPTLHGEPARLWICRPEAVAGHKLQALWHRGTHGWRPKDLADLYLLLVRVPMDPADLRGSLAGYLADVGAKGEQARALFGPGSFWSLKIASARWLDFVETPQAVGVPRDLAIVAAEVFRRLEPILEGIP